MRCSALCTTVCSMTSLKQQNFPIESASRTPQLLYSRLCPGRFERNNEGPVRIRSSKFLLCVINGHGLVTGNYTTAGLATLSGPGLLQSIQEGRHFVSV